MISGRRVSPALGFATEQRFSFKTNLTPRDYPTAARVDAFYDQLTTRLAAMPATMEMGAVSYLPLSGEGQSAAATPDQTASGRAAAAATAEVAWRIVRGEYFQAMGVPLVAGRFFQSGDHASSLPVAIVDERLARQWWGSASAALGPVARRDDRRRRPHRPHRQPRPLRRAVSTPLAAILRTE